MKKVVCMVVILTLVMSLFSGITVFARSGKNAVGKAHNRYAVSDGKYVYYSADRHLYRENVGGGNRKSLVDGDSYEELTVQDDYLYYKRALSNYIYRVNINGQEAKEDIVSGEDYIFYDNYMYVMGSRNFKTTIFKCKINDWNNEVEIVKGINRSGFVILDDRIYFDNNNSELGSSGLASVNLKGKDFESYMVGEITSIVAAYDNMIYFTQDGHIKRMSKSGKIETINEIDSFDPIIYEDYIYFRDLDNGSKLARISLNDEEKEISSLKVNSDICIVEDKVYSRSSDSYKNVIIEDLPQFSVTGNKNHKDNSNDVFTDVSVWAEDEVNEAYENGLVPEYFEGKDLTKKISRAEFAAIAVQTYEIISKKSVSSKSTPFEDISGHELKKDIGKAYKLNVAIGMSDTEFWPDSDITREQLATMLCRVIKKYKYPDWTVDTDDEYYIGGSNVKKFDDDLEISDYAKDAVYFMYSVGIINGIGKNRFAPKNTTEYQKSIDYASATREQAIVMANRIYERKGSF